MDSGVKFATRLCCSHVVSALVGSSAHIPCEKCLKNATFQAQDQAQLKTLRMFIQLPLTNRNAHNAGVWMSSKCNVYHVH